jgi:hypothetical protein
MFEGRKIFLQDPAQSHPDRKAMKPGLFSRCMKDLPFY